MNKKDIDIERAMRNAYIPKLNQVSQKVMREKRESPTKHSGFEHHFLKRKDGKPVFPDKPDRGGK